MKKMRNVLHEILKEDLSPSEVIRGARVELGLSQDDVSLITGLKRPNISALENNKIPMTLHYAEILGAVYNIHPADILYPNRKFEISNEVKEMVKRASKIIEEKKAI